MYTRKQVLHSLSKVIHPEKGIDIVSLGMVSEIQTDDVGISIIITPEKSNDPFISSVKSTIARILKENLGPDAQIRDIIVKPRTAVSEVAGREEQVLPGVKNIIAVSSGKGGVGKTTVAVNLSIAIAGRGFRVGLLDADVFGPSVPKMFNAEKYRPELIRRDNKDFIVPLCKYNVKVLSTGFFVDPSDAVVWRGPMASGFL